MRAGRSFLKRTLYGIGALVLLPALSGWAYQTLMQSRDTRRFPPPGKLVDVRGHLMHIHCQGTGSPTIIVEQGIGAQSLGWSQLNQRMAGVSTLCAYDRRGMGYSEPVDHPTPATEVARNLNDLLRSAGVNDDIVLVGWSAGGMYSREYYRQFPARVKGIVLVDSSHEQQTHRMSPVPPAEAFDRMKVYRYLAPLGWVRASGRIERQFASAPLPPALRDRLIAINLKSHLHRTLLNEGAGFETDLGKNQPPPKLGDIPLIVLSEGKPNIPYMQENLKTWFGLQEELAHLSTNGQHIVAQNSTHAIHRTEPELVLESVRRVVEAARTGGRLDQGGQAGSH
jgi:pimeloyl-ACP methyl ester carboxylesterase